MVPLTLLSCLQRFLYAMCVFEQLLGGLDELHHVVLLDVHLLQLLQLASKVSSVAYQIHILHLTEILWWWSHALKLQFEKFSRCLGEKMSGGELLCTTAARRLKFGIWPLWCIYFDNPLSFLWAKHFCNTEKSGQITRDLSYFWDTWVLVITFWN